MRLVAPEPPVHLARLFASLLVVAAAFDVCFWSVHGLGLSLPVFVIILAAAILANRTRGERRNSSVVFLVLLIGAAGCGIIETGITNSLCLLALTLLLAGDTWFRDIDSSWGRWMSQMVTCLLAPGRLFWLSGRLLEATSGRRLGGIGSILGVGAMTLPAIFLAMIFGSLLATGNAVFGSWTSNFFGWFWNELGLFFDPARILLWGFVAFLTLPLLRPAQVSPCWWGWLVRLPRLPEVVPTSSALLSSTLVLMVLNLLFLVANAADAMFLWTKNTLPAGVTYSSYVHSGVNALTTTVLLSAFVLAGIFQQDLKIAGRGFLKTLGFAWVAQNVFLLVSVMLRLKLYIEAYDMTVLRLGVIIFLLLVAVGYGLLAIKIMREKSLSWLMGGSTLAIFGTFYITQFLDLAGWAANYNLAQWERDKSRNLDIAYLRELGPAAWPAIRRALLDDPSFNANTHDVSNQAALDERYQPKASFDAAHWREFSLRAYWNSAALEDKK